MVRCTIALAGNLFKVLLQDSALLHGVIPYARSLEPTIMQDDGPCCPELLYIRLKRKQLGVIM